VPFILQIQSGPLVGKQVLIEDGRSLRFGRGPQSDVVLPNDPQVSALHFELTFENAICRVRDLRSSNGTYVNGRRIETATLSKSDRVRAGGTEILILGFEEVSTANLAAPVKLAFQGWTFAAAPDGWEVLEGRGFRRTAKDRFPANIVVTAETILGEASLKDYVDSQLIVLGKYLNNLTSDVFAMPPLSDCDEAVNLILRHAADNGKIVAQRQVYVRRGKSVGVLTFTTLDEEFSTTQSALESLTASASFVGVLG
jgi:hypothetical protein